MSGGTPEQVIGNAMLLARRLMRCGVRIHNRPQAVGSAVIGSLRDNGYEVVPRTELDHLRSWKAQATEVIGSWEQVWEALDRPGRLGESKATAVLRAVGESNGRSEP